MPTPTTYVIDTNVLLYDPNVFDAYPNAEIVIPIEVIEAIDKFKGVLSETGSNARNVSNRLDEFRRQGNLSDGITLSNQGRLRIELPSHAKEESYRGLDLNKASNRILVVALHLQESGMDVVLVTLDTNLRVKANAFGIQVMHYDQTRYPSSVYPEIERREISGAQLDKYRKQDEFRLDGDFLPNDGIVLLNQTDPKDYAVATYQAATKQFKMIHQEWGAWDMVPRNPEQHLALGLLLDPKIAIVSLIGKAGTGKTLFALAAGLNLMMMENKFSRMLVSRPVFPMGRDLGYLPGDLQEKMSPWMQPIFDNLELLLGTTGSSGNSSSWTTEAYSGARELRNAGYHELIEQGLLVIEALTYIRGRSIPNQYMIVDEAQNLTPHEIKTIITRAGDGSKIVLTGDPDQIDNPYVDKVSNGLSYLVEKFRQYEIAGHVTLRRGERSGLAELAANVL